MPQNPTPAAAGDTNPTTNLTPEIGSLEHLASMSPEMRFSTAYVWAKYAESAVNFTPADSFKGTLVHLQWAVTEIERLRTELAQRDKDLEPYEALNAQQCPAGQHADWLVDSEYTHACPWCRVAELEAEAASGSGVVSALTVIVKHGNMSDAVRREIRDLLPSQREAGAL